MKQPWFMLFFITLLTPAMAQVEPRDAEVPARQPEVSAGNEGSAKRRFGYSIFAGVGRSGNDQAKGLTYGFSARGHYGIHTLNAYTAQAATFSLSGREQSERRDLHGSYAGITYGLGYYSENITLSAGAGLGYSTVRMRLGAGTSLQQIYYERYGGCVGDQFSVHGKYLGWGTQFYINLTEPQTNTIFLTGLEIRI